MIVKWYEYGCIFLLSIYSVGATVIPLHSICYVYPCPTDNSPYWECASHAQFFFTAAQIFSVPAGGLVYISVWTGYDAFC